MTEMYNPIHSVLNFKIFYKKKKNKKCIIMYSCCGLNPNSNYR